MAPNPWCVNHREGWCACSLQARRPSDTAMQVRTKCGTWVHMPWGIERRKPTCAVCLGKVEKESPEKWLNEDKVVNGLFIKLRTASLVLAPRYTPPRWFECDLFSLTRSGYFVEHEVKLTVSDFKADESKRDPIWRRGERAKLKHERQTKHDRLAAADTRGPSRFFYVVPEGMISADDVPEWAGLKYARPYGKRSILRLVKKAPQIHKEKMPHSDKVIRQLQERLYYRFWNHRLKA